MRSRRVIYGNAAATFLLDSIPPPGVIFCSLPPACSGGRCSSCFRKNSEAEDIKAYSKEILRLDNMSGERKMHFEKAATQNDEGLLVEYLRFLSRNKKYWLIPIIAVLLLIGLLVMLGGSAAGAFIYTLF